MLNLRNLKSGIAQKSGLGMVQTARKCLRGRTIRRLIKFASDAVAGPDGE
jgi:hypothetical protein